MFEINWTETREKKFVLKSRAMSSVPKSIATEFSAELSKFRSELNEVVGVIQRYGAVVNLSGSLKLDSLWLQVAEALLGWRALVSCGLEAKRWVDVGAGGGFPGLVFAVLLKKVGHARGLLMEPRERRADFLRLALLELGVKNVDVWRGSIEVDGRLNPTFPVPEADWVSARAVFDPTEWRRRARCGWPTAVRMLHLPGSQVLSEDGVTVLATQHWQDMQVQLESDARCGVTD